MEYSFYMNGLAYFAEINVTESGVEIRKLEEVFGNATTRPIVHRAEFMTCKGFLENEFKEEIEALSEIDELTVLEMKREQRLGK